MRTFLMSVRLIIVIGLCGLQTSFAAEMKPKDQPIEYFSNLPISHYGLSPSGQRIGYFVPLEGRRTLVVHNLDGSDRRIVPPWDEKMELVNFFWKTEDVVIFQVHMTLKRREFLTKTTETRLMSFDVKENKAEWLGQPKRGPFGRGDELYNSQNERVVDRMPNDPEHILIQLDFELDGYPSVYRVNVKTGTRKEVQKQRTGTNNWYADDSGVVRLGFGYRATGSKEKYRYLSADGVWQDLDGLETLDNFELVDLGPEPGQVYMRGRNEFGTQSMFLVDLMSGEILETLFSHQEVDIDSTTYHPATGKIAGVSYRDDFWRDEFFDKDLSVVQRSLERALSGYVVTITDKARDANLYLILADNDRDPGQYYLFDRDNKQLNYFASFRPEIDPELSSPTTRVDIPVADGSTIPGYLTLPIGREGKSLPTVVLPHGGPQARDSADWDFEAQFYASRGYAVLKPNFRGSTGYGNAFLEAGEKQWGGLMQQDVTDATKWLVSEGIADPKRICLVGASYGGYAAMMGLIQEGGLYACGISVNGVMNLPALKSSDRNTIGGRSWIKKMGLEGADDKEVSPQQQAERIKDPVLLVAAKNDARISYTQTAKFHKTLKRLKKDSTYVEIETGTHYMLNSESRHAMLQAAEKFLAEHLD